MTLSTRDSLRPHCPPNRVSYGSSGVTPEGATLHPDSGSAIYNGVLFTSADKNPSNVEGNSQSDFYAFNALTGQVLWTYFPNQLGAKHDGLVAVDVDRRLVLYPAHDGCIRALDKDTGETIHAAVSGADGRIYVGSNKTHWAFGP